MFECYACNQTFDCLYKLITHRNVHNANRDENTCPICHNLFLSEKNLQNHVRLIHTREAPFHCETCNKPFLRKDHLMRHTLTHKDGLHCAKCGEIFKSKELLKVHGASHGPIRSFQCPHCPKKYTRNEHLQTHLRSHSSELEHLCLFCNQQFWRECHLDEHVKIHKFNSITNECVCAVCGVLVDATFLKKHMDDKHEGTKKFRCELCGKSFLKKGNLIFHKKSHLNNENKV